jgi:hypothetical protein
LTAYGLARLCQENLRHDPFVGSVFVFRNRKGTALKVLMYDGPGFWLCHKRLSQGHFPWWPSAAEGGAQRLALPQPTTVRTTNVAYFSVKPFAILRLILARGSVSQS